MAAQWIHIFTGCVFQTVTDLVEVRVGLRLPHPVEVLHVDQLEVKGQARVWNLELWLFLDVRQVAQVFVAPVVQVAEAAGRCRFTRWVKRDIIAKMLRFEKS